MKNLSSVEKRIALSVGDRVKFVAENGQAPIRVLGETNPFEKYRGPLKRFRSRKEINAWVGEMRDEEKRCPRE
jgi:hypothetical protein